MAEALTQEEIDALLRGESPPSAGGEGAAALTPEEEDAVNRFSAAVCAAGADVFSALLGEKAELTVTDVDETGPDDIDSRVEGPAVAAELKYGGLLRGKCLLAVQSATALGIAGQMTGGGAETEFGDLEESAYGEAVQSLFNTVNTQLTKDGGGEISLEPIDIATEPESLSPLMPESPEPQILVEYRLKCGGVEGPLYHVIPRNILNAFANLGGEAGGQEDEGEGGRGRYGSPGKTPGVFESPARFDLGGGGREGTGPPVDISNLELILDITVEVKVELGRTRRKIKDVLELGPGSVVELDRLAGEPVDILVNDKLFAKGEVVVIDENFGVRITDILSIQERIEALK